MNWLLIALRLIYQVTEGQLLTKNKECLANLKELSFKINREITEKFDREVQEIKDQLNPDIFKRTRQNFKLSSNVDGKDNSEIDCKWYRDKFPNITSGVYELSVNGLVFQAYCIMQHSGDVWTSLFQVRYPKQHIPSTWQKYKHGFSVFKYAFWLGNERMHRLTKGRPSDVYTKYVMLNGSYRTKYKNFTMSSDDRKYTVTYQDIEGDKEGRDLLPNNTAFSTYDNYSDPDNCAFINNYGWWYDESCSNHTSMKFISFFARIRYS